MIQRTESDRTPAAQGSPEGEARRTGVAGLRRVTPSPTRAARQDLPMRTLPVVGTAMAGELVPPAASPDRPTVRRPSSAPVLGEALSRVPDTAATPGRESARRTTPSREPDRGRPPTEQPSLVVPLTRSEARLPGGESGPLVPLLGDRPLTPLLRVEGGPPTRRPVVRPRWTPAPDVGVQRTTPRHAPPPRGPLTMPVAGSTQRTATPTSEALPDKGIPKAHPTVTTSKTTTSPKPADLAKPAKDEHEQIDPDRLARRLIEPVARLLRAELRSGRERSGRLHDR
ncbi:hypothetical protein [Saccharothrix violaceirubra]|uniref:Syndecan 1 n=1 Tax=Saccharothrix violaceirubra TaxID=413306 RepID=A0A7W7T2K3_9PSEU|nr:hypothetical protein [Saccharothrix violaceirubra]MBB4965398.1 hypothetical protein [Saccharothrix violaceirubra]